MISSWMSTNTDTLLRYRYFDQNHIPGPILTTDPVFAAFSDKRYIPFYDTARDIIFVNDWEIYYRFSAIAYVNSSLPCPYKDDSCIQQRKDLFSSIKADDKMVYHDEDNNAAYYIFLTPSSLP